MRRPSAKRKAAGLKAARTRKRNQARRSMIAKKAAVTRSENKWNATRRTCI